MARSLVLGHKGSAAVRLHCVAAPGDVVENRLHRREPKEQRVFPEKKPSLEKQDSEGPAPSEAQESPLSQ